MNGGVVGTQTAVLPAGCATGATCSVSVSAPTGSSTVAVLVYGNSVPVGTPLAYASQPFAGFSNQSTIATIALSGVMASFTATISPSTVTVGQGTPLSAGVVASDAAGERLAPGFVTTALATPAFVLSVNDPSGAVTVPQGYLVATYSGIGSGPATFTMSAATYPSANVTLGYTAAAPLTIDYAIAGYTAFNSSPSVSIEPLPGSSMLPRILTPPTVVSSMAFDPSGTLWMSPSTGSPMSYVGIEADGSAAGTLSFPGPLLAFDMSDDAYALGAVAQSNIVNVYAIANGTPTLVRSLTTASPACSAAVANGELFVALCAGGVYAYASSGNGAIAPTTGNTAAASPVVTDASGDVYASYGGTIGEWFAGGFGPAAPAKTFGAGPTSAGDVTVDPSGNLFAAYSSGFGATNLIEFPAGSTTGTTLQVGPRSITVLAAPLH